MTPQSLTHVRTGGDGVLSRRTFLRTVAASAGAGLLGWKDAVALHADELRKQGLACILLFMRGGPSQLETFDPKPGTPNGGPTEAIDTAVDGVRVARSWPNVARVMKEVALVRSVTNKEAEHVRAAYQLHTGYLPGGGLKHPSLGSVVAAELGPADFDLPHFVSVGNRANAFGAGFLGTSVAPFVVANPLQMPANVELPSGVGDQRFGERLKLLDELEKDFAEGGAAAQVEEHRTLYRGAADVVLSPRLKAFDVAAEKDGVRDRYGRTPFGQGCLLARRLVEAGVTFVEVESGGWDTHQDNFERVRSLSETVDPALAALVGDLKDRGRLERTLVVWMGEFGRSPKINANAGRDHYPRAFTVALAGAGVKGGQVVGATSDDALDVKDRPVTVADLFCTFCRALRINPRKENVSPAGRPLKIVDGGEAVNELF
jgi:hypothetical protein